MPDAIRPITYRWLVLVCMGVTIGVQSRVRIAFGVFYVTLRETFGWSAASTAGVFSIYRLVQARTSGKNLWPHHYGLRLGGRTRTLVGRMVGGPDRQLHTGHCRVHDHGQYRHDVYVARR